MKKKTAFILALATFVVGVGATVGASAAIKEIKAQLRPDFTVKIEGEVAKFKNADGETVYPILYEGTTYLPIRAIGEIMGKTVFWYEDEKLIELRAVTDTTVTDADVIIEGSENAAAKDDNNKYKTKEKDAKNKKPLPGDDKEKPEVKPVEKPAAPEEKGFIGEERAREIALEKAGLKESEVTLIKVKLDRDDGRYVYEIEFRRGLTEYEAEINAEDGRILKFEKDFDD
ncbi:MAG: PepSY domain-containing protein [Clostridia bacterium]|nr:PepSY domain-containing protein [Clostridia bacterium]